MDKIKLLIKSVFDAPFYREQAASITELPPREEKTADFPGLHSGIKEYLARSGIKKLYTHQVLAAQKSLAGKNVILATPTASGKTLAFNIPVFEQAAKDPCSRALYIYPAKALSNDQLKNINEMSSLSGIKITAGIYDGDTDAGQKRFLRENAGIIITNPYELHHILPHHPKFRKFYSGLKYIILDEAHRYKGVFGSNIAFLLRRLKRITSLYGAEPRFIASSASIANPGEFIEKLTGEEFECITESGAPSGRKFLVMWDSSAYPEKSVHTQSKDLLLLCAKKGVQTLCFTTSRKLAELIRMWAVKEDKKTKILSYRAGYTPELRREIEHELKSGSIQGVVSTNALELGIDIGMLDVIILSGYPGSVSSFWQQAGRAGRKMQDSAVFFLPFEDALQKYILKNPEILTSFKYENAVISTDNPDILNGQILCALSETPAKTDEIFSGIDTKESLCLLLERGLAARTPRGIIYSGGIRPQEAVSLNTIGGREIKIKFNGRILEEVSIARAYETAHKGAVHLFNGETYVIKELNIPEGYALAEREDTDYYTSPVKDEEVEIIRTEKSIDFSGFSLKFGRVKVTEFFKGYKRKRMKETLSTEDLALSPLVFTTESVWVEMDGTQERAVKKAGYDFDGALHAAEHALIGMSPLPAMCDRNDLGGRSYPLYSNGACIIFIYDAYEGGIGISKKLFSVFETLKEETEKMIFSCECETGCPACVYSPKCGNNNSPIDKQGALFLLKTLVFTQ